MIIRASLLILLTCVSNFCWGDAHEKPPVGMFHPEELEKFSLENLEYLGMVEDKVYGVAALIKDPLGKTHRVRVGDYIGRHFGKIIKIKKCEITLIEAYEENGHWIEKRNKLVNKKCKYNE